MKLTSVYKNKRGVDILLDLLKKRDPIENISHREMPSWEDHAKFFYSKPYLHWNFVENDAGKIIGAAYLSRAFEIGVHLFPEFKNKGYEQQAIQMMMVLYGRPRYFVNVSVNNWDMMGVVKELGFNHVQNTYEFVYDKR